MKGKKTPYGLTLPIAEALLTGPSGLSIGEEYWGRPYLRFGRRKLPPMKGVCESRSVYANPDDEEQDSGILRQALWNAEQAFQQSIMLVKEGKKPETYQPDLSVRYVWVEIAWITETVQKLEQLNIPLKSQIEDVEIYSTQYQLRIERSDRTVIEAVWNRDLAGELSHLTTTWESIWEEMGLLLKSSESVIPEED